ncbi:MAG: glutathione S-transferase [Sphingomonadales bacterium 17-56-6]|nr:MAG: glutathione S-transferase [Sphingomonadales bacterium 28-55-16]OYZ87105.1 MAG: glutathione S-transferase [Sphingomonadales bacterium 17-56-6]
MSIIVHHLNNSRSQRILWLLEELKVPYEIRHYARDAVTNLAPEALLSIHPLGKSPMIEDAGNLILESAAIVEYLCERHNGGHLVPARGTDQHIRYLEFMHFAEGSVMTPILLNLYTARLGEAAAPLHPRIQQQLDSHFAFMEETLKPTGWFVGDSLTGADIMMSFPTEAAVKMGHAANRPNLAAFVEKIHARPAFQTALEKGGPYAYA